MDLVNQAAKFGAGRFRRELTAWRPVTRRRLPVLLLILVALLFSAAPMT